MENVRPPAINLTVMRFILGDDAIESTIEPDHEPNDPRILTVITDNDRDKQLDEDYVNEFRIRTANDESIIYAERVVNNGEETVAPIKSVICWCRRILRRQCRCWW
ncbi:hypothetical protein ACSBR2_040896 [Camellia fascicularis]